MRHRCTHCDHSFEASGDKPRCPKCLRVSGVEQVVERPPAVVRRPPNPLWLVVGLVMALAELGAFLYGAIAMPEGKTAIATVVGAIAWAGLSTTLVVAGLRGALARMQ
jgi:hypothetical protein